MSPFASAQEAAKFANAWLDEPMPIGMGPSLEPAAPTFWERITGPWLNFGQSLWTGAGQAIEDVYEQVPEMLFEWGTEKIGITERTVKEGPGRTVTYIQPEHPGGVPQQAPLIILPGQGLATLPAQVRDTIKSNSGILIAIGIGLVVLFALKK